jgi:sec-independent protein translocase protein TatA
MFRSPLIDAVVVILIVLLIFGPKRLPELGKGLGRGMREFKEGITGESGDDDDRPTITTTQSVSDPTRAGTPTPHDHVSPGNDSSEVGSERRS